MRPWRDALAWKTCNKSNPAKICKPRGECSTIPAKYFGENVKQFTKESRNTSTL